MNIVPVIPGLIFTQPMALPLPPSKPCGCSRKCPCVDIGIGEVEVLKPGQTAYVNVEKNEADCSYTLHFGLPTPKIDLKIGDVESLDADALAYAEIETLPDGSFELHLGLPRSK